MSTSLSIDGANRRVTIGMARQEWVNLGYRSLHISKSDDGDVIVTGEAKGFLMNVREVENDRVQITVASQVSVDAIMKYFKEGFYRMNWTGSSWTAVWARPCKRYTRGTPKAEPSFLVVLDDAEFTFPKTHYAGVIKELTRLEDALNS